MERAAHPNTFMISIRVLNNGITNHFTNHFMSVSEKMTVKEVKGRFADKFNIDVNEKEIRIIVCGEIVEDHQTCSEWSSITCPHIIVTRKKV